MRVHRAYFTSAGVLQPAAAGIGDGRDAGRGREASGRQPLLPAQRHGLGCHAAASPDAVRGAPPPAASHGCGGQTRPYGTLFRVQDPKQTRPYGLRLIRVP